PFSSTLIPRRWFQSCIVKPTSSCPCSFNNAAAAELSTPPLIATAIFIKPTIYCDSEVDLVARFISTALNRCPRCPTVPTFFCPTRVPFRFGTRNLLFLLELQRFLPLSHDF